MTDGGPSPSQSGATAHLWLWAGWLALGGVLLAACFVLTASSTHFGPEIELIDMPAIPLAGGLVAAGIAFLLIVPLILASLARGMGTSRALLWLMLGFGLAFRLALMGSMPAFEDDWYRYLWDGAVVAHGFNPYAAAPEDALSEPNYYTLQPLAKEAGDVFDNINHADIKTIYPPVTELAFAAAYLTKPWSLAAWRGVVLGCEIATLLLLLALARDAGRPALWVALYWWNPVVVKELANSAHMEAIVTPFILGALLLTIRKRPLWATTSLGVAIGAKIWPALLAPLILRPLVATPRRLAVALTIFASLSALYLAPILAGGIDETSGFVVYAQYWRNSSAHFAPMADLVLALGSGLLTDEAAGLVARAILAGLATAFALWMAATPAEEPADLLRRAGLITAALYLLSPSQFPWYAIWMLPFIVFRPWAGLLAISALIPIYYVSFHFQALDTYEIYRDRIVWLIWLPVWSLLAWEGRRVARGAGPLIPGDMRGAHA